MGALRLFLTVRLALSERAVTASAATELHMQRSVPPLIFTSFTRGIRMGHVTRHAAYAHDHVFVIATRSCWSELPWESTLPLRMRRLIKSPICTHAVARNAGAATRG